MFTFYCKNCARPIFTSEDIIKKVNLWDLKDYQAEAYMIKQAIDVEKLRRYDCSLHQGWYCCRFIMMRMVQDKFGTGDNLLVYTDSVLELPEGEIPTIKAKHPDQISLGLEDFDIITQDQNSSTLKVVKLGAIWCPPCRLMDSVIHQMVEEKIFPEIEFFEVDIDKEQKIASQFKNQSIPYFLFYYKGRKIQVESEEFANVDGGIIGGIQKDNFIKILRKIFEQGKEGLKIIKL